VEWKVNNDRKMGRNGKGRNVNEEKVSERHRKETNRQKISIER
jgi:hypothetical protein